MTLEETTQLYASVLRQLLPTGGYDTSPNTEALAVDVYAHAKLLAQADLDAKRLLKVLEGFPPELINEYETEYDLPLKCTVNAGKTLEERIDLLKWVRSTRNVLNKAYLEQILAFFGVELFELRKYTPLQCTAPCNAPVNTEQLRYKVLIIIPDDTAADLDCIIENYLPGYLRIDVLKVPLLFKTSKPYPYIFTESLFAGFAIDEAIQKQVMNETEKLERIETSFAIASATIREALNTHALDIECVETSFAIAGAQITVENKPPTYITANLVDAIGISFAITGAQITVENKPPVYINTNIDIERIETSFAIAGAQITN